MKPESAPPNPPKNVPPSARWDAEEKCFRLGELDAQGRKKSTWKAWYPSGAVYGEEQFEAGLQHGPSWFVRGQGTETPFDDTFDLRVHRLERVYDHAILVQERCLTREGAVVSSNGEPWPARPADVPADSCYLSACELWVNGPIRGPITGRQRLWYREGQLLADAEWLDGQRHGKSRLYNYEGLTLSTDIIGPYATHLMDTDYDHGTLQKVACFARGMDEPILLAHFQQGKLQGVLSWWVGRYATIALNFVKPYFAFDQAKVELRELFGKPQIPNTFRIDAEFNAGKLINTKAFDKKGVELRPGAQQHGLAHYYNLQRDGTDGEPKGPPHTHLIKASYNHGSLEKITFLDREGAELAAAHFHRDKLQGTLTWWAERHNLSEPVLVIGKTKVECKELLGKRRLPGTVRIEAVYDKGKLVQAQAFDQAGKRLIPPGPVSDFGEKLAQKDLSGYIARGALAADLESFFPDRSSPEMNKDAVRTLEALAHLPKTHQAAAKAFDALARNGKFPYLVTCNLEAYGFDGVKNDLPGVDARYFGLAYDGSGNMQFLDLKTGSVLGYEHEEGVFEPQRAFNDLDGWAFCMLRIELASEQRIPVPALKKLFKRLGLTGGIYELSLLADNA